MLKNFLFRVINMKAWPAYIVLVIALHFSVLTASGQDFNTIPPKVQGPGHGAQGAAPVVTEEFDRKLTEAVKLQYSADSITRLAQGVRREMETAAPERQEVLQSIAEEI